MLLFRTLKGDSEMVLGDPSAYSIVQFNHRSKPKRLMILLCEKSLSAKIFFMKILVKRKKKYTPKYIERIDRQFNSCISKMELPSKYNDEKNKMKLYYDVLFCDYAYGAHPDEFFFYEYQYLNTEGRKEFITDRLRYEYYQIMNDVESAKKLFNKFQASQIFSEYYKRDTMYLESENDNEKLYEFLKRHGGFIKKPFSWGLGIGVEIVKYEGQTLEDLAKLISEYCAEGPCIIEEIIIQNDDMASIHPYSVNTVRWCTVVTNGQVHTFHPFMKWGVSKSKIDNASQGGILAGIDEVTGIVNTCAVDKSNHKFTIHPTTNVPIVGFQVPQWEELRKMVYELALVMPEVRYVGWDLALTKENGWVVVECNPWGEFIGQQWPRRHGLRQEFESIM